MKLFFICLLFCTLIPLRLTASDLEIAHNAWMQNRPAEAIPLLYKQALSSDAWYDYFDLGRAAYDNGERGKAIAWLLAAHLRAPNESAPRAALQAMQVELPHSWLENIGPFASLGSGWVGCLIMLSSGLCFGLACFYAPRRWTLIVTASCGLVLALPGSIAHSLDKQQQLISVVVECPLLDPTGQPLQTLAPGTILIEEKRLNHDRMLVRLAHSPNNLRGFIDSSYCHALPSP